jgi:hypothetical protein
MANGLYSNPIIIERTASSTFTTGTTFPTFVAPADLTIVGLLAYVSTAPGGSFTVNVNNSPTSQGATPSGSTGLTAVGSYNLWTSANVPTITGPAKFSTAITNTTAVIENLPYALNYPLPGATGAGTTGYVTAQQAAQATPPLGSNANAVSSPPKLYAYGLNNLVAPDSTYTDLNGITQSTALVHAGDVLTFVIGGTPTSAVNLQISLFALKN